MEKYTGVNVHTLLVVDPLLYCHSAGMAQIKLNTQVLSSTISAGPGIEPLSPVGWESPGALTIKPCPQWKEQWNLTLYDFKAYYKATVIKILIPTGISIDIKD